MYGTRGPRCVEHVSGVSWVLWDAEFKRGDVITEFSKPSGRTFNPVVISNPTPKEQVLFAFRNFFQSIKGDEHVLRIKSTVRSYHRLNGWPLGKRIKVQFLCGAGVSKGISHLAYYSPSRGSSAVGPRVPKSPSDNLLAILRELSAPSGAANINHGSLARGIQFVSRPIEQYLRNSAYSQNTSENCCPYCGRRPARVWRVVQFIFFSVLEGGAFISIIFWTYNLRWMRNRKKLIIAGLLGLLSALVWWLSVVQLITLIEQGVYEGISRRAEGWREFREIGAGCSSSTEGHDPEEATETYTPQG